MKFNRIRIIVLIGIIAFVGIIVIQVYWLRQAFDLEEKKLSQNIQVSLLDVANEINDFYGYQTPLINPVKKISDDYYVVNIHNDFDAKVLELYLVNIFSKKGINSDFEYAIYDCETDKMVYGSYVSMNKSAAHKASAHFPKVNNLVYYFAVRFPDKTSHIFASLNLWVLLSVIMIIVLVIYLYSIYVILQQKKYADLQKDFINNMTHEFKTPLASILIAANYLSRQQALINDPKLEKYAQIVIDQGTKLNSHVETILNLAKSDITPIILEKKSFKLIDAINDTVETIKLRYVSAEVIIEDQIPDQSIVADEFHFANIVYNFLDNSIKYCDKEPRIIIQVYKENDQPVITFTDNGIGIPNKYQKLVFEKFFRVPGDKVASTNGFGLGLYYVQKICQLQQWKLSLENNITGGITVKLKL